jgi:hypothetical protein
VSANDRQSFARTAAAVGRVPCQSTARSKVRAEADWTDVVSQLQVCVTDVLLHSVGAKVWCGGPRVDPSRSRLNRGPIS